jgi:hypothetical protein
VSKPRIVYIMGMGRSGSTVLDAVIGSHPLVCGVGELSHFVRSGWLQGEYCACGERGDACPFWTEVCREWSRRIAPMEITAYPPLQETFESFSSWPRLLLERMWRSSRFRVYGHLSASLFDAIRAVSGRPIVVDSSKAPMRAYALAMTGALDLRLVHLVRDPRGVAWSMLNPHPQNGRVGMRTRSAVSTAVRWLLVNFQSFRTARRLPREHTTTVRYEEVATDPKAFLGQIGEMTGLDFGAVASAVGGGMPIAIGHATAGNPLRMRRSFELRPNTDWMARLPLRDERLVWTIAGPLMRRLGYRRR